MRLNEEHGPVVIAALFGAFWTALCIVWTVEAEREGPIVGSMALLMTTFGMGSWLLSALVISTASFLPQDRPSRALGRAAIIVYVLQPLTVRGRY